MWRMSVVILVVSGCTIATVETPVLRDRDKELPGKSGEEPSGEGVDGGAAPSPDASQPNLVPPSPMLEAGVETGAPDAAQSGACRAECINRRLDCGPISATCDCGTCASPRVCGNLTDPRRQPPNKCVCPDVPEVCVTHNGSGAGYQVPTAHGYDIFCASDIRAVQMDQCSRIPGYYCCP